MLRSDRAALGSTPGQLECWLLLRSLRTLHLRAHRQAATAAALAAWLHAALDGGGGGGGGGGGSGGDADQPHPLRGLIAAVAHPSLPSDPSHAVAARQMAGGVAAG